MDVCLLSRFKNKEDNRLDLSLLSLFKNEEALRITTSFNVKVGASLRD